jgi:hypothetical protein
LIGPALQEFIELRLGGPDDLVFQHLYPGRSTEG